MRRSVIKECTADHLGGPSRLELTPQVVAEDLGRELQAVAVESNAGMTEDDPGERRAGVAVERAVVHPVSEGAQAAVAG